MSCDMWSALGRPLFPESCAEFFAERRLKFAEFSVTGVPSVFEAINPEVEGQRPPAGVPQYPGVGDEKLVATGEDKIPEDSGVAGKVGRGGRVDLVGVWKLISSNFREITSNFVNFHQFSRVHRFTKHLWRIADFQICSILVFEPLQIAKILFLPNFVRAKIVQFSIFRQIVKSHN